MLRLWIRLVSVLVPSADRRQWIEEWDAELTIAPRAKRDAWGALPDAWYLRTDGWTMERVIQDLHAAVAGLVRRPFFTLVAGVTLAIGIGANTAIYSVVDGVLINPLPYPDSDRIVSVNFTAPGVNVPVAPLSEGIYLYYLERFHSLESLAVFETGDASLITDGVPQRIVSARVTQGFFDVMGVPTKLGRAFVPGEDRPGAEPVAILGYALWQQSFGGDPSVVGRVVEIDGVMRTVVGVMPQGFRFPNKAGVWLPREIDDANPSMGNLSLLGVGRAIAGASPRDVDAEMQALLMQFAEQNPDEMPPGLIEEAGLAADVKPLKDLYVGDIAQALWVLLGTVGFVLLIACANVANLFLVRAESRQREVAVRTALGATRGDMVRHYLSESVLLAVGAGVVGLAIASAGVRALLALSPIQLPRVDEIGIDGSVLAFAALISVGSGILFGLFPLFGHARRDVSGGLKEGGRASTGGRQRQRARSVLVVVQVALALMLLVGSGLMARSFVALRGVDAGFEDDERMTFKVSLPVAEYPEAEDVSAFHRSLQERLDGMPGVRAAAIATALPLQEYTNAGAMEAEDRPFPEDKLAPIVNRRRVSPGYFATMGIRLLEGRELTWEEMGENGRVAVIGETLARALWPGESPVGRRIRSQGATASFEVVGVAADVRLEKLSESPQLLAYLPIVYTGSDESTVTRKMSVAMHVSGDPLGFIDAAKSALAEVDPRLPMIEPKPVARITEDAMASTSFTVLMLGIAAGIALLLGTVGIYGVVSHVVGARTQEIGVRMALGARAATVLRSVVGQGMVIATIGVVVGLFGAWGLSRVLASLLYGVSSSDPVTYVATAAILSLVALLASWIPARRAARVDPVEALRAE